MIYEKVILTPRKCRFFKGINSVDPETAISSRSTLFAKVMLWISLDYSWMVKSIFKQINLIIYGFVIFFFLICELFKIVKHSQVFLFHFPIISFFLQPMAKFTPSNCHDYYSDHFHYES